MHVIEVNNVNEAMYYGLRYLNEHGIEEDSRNGKVLVAPGPVTTVYNRPWERVLFSPLRDANPFFHVMEAIWMLAGRDDVEFPAYFNNNFKNYSDDGVTVHGAYGMRWRDWFGYDQLFEIADELKRNPTSRRCVLGMWDASRWRHKSDVAVGSRQGMSTIIGDFHTAIAGGKDVPCNTQAYFDVRQGKLNITVCCRSNDIWWGAYGANAVHFSVLQEYMAALIGVPMGIYRQISNNYHLYLNVVPRERLQAYAKDALMWNLYSEDYEVTRNPNPIESTLFIDHNVELWNPIHLNNWIENGGHVNTFLYHIANPMRSAYKERKEKMGTGVKHITLMTPGDWRTACEMWIARREQKK